MKHKFEDDVNVNIHVDIPVDEIVDGVVTIIVVATAAHILRRWVT